MDEPLDFEESTEIIRGIAKFGSLKFSTHVRERLSQRGASFKDVKSILATGTVTSCERDPKTYQWKYRVEGRTADDNGIAITVIASHRVAFIVTVFF